MKYEEIIYNEVMILRKDVEDLKRFNWKLIGAASASGAIGGFLVTVIITILQGG